MSLFALLLLCGFFSTPFSHIFLGKEAQRAMGKKGKTAPFSQVLFQSEHVHGLLTTQECPRSLLLLSKPPLKQVRLPRQCYSQPAKRNPRKGDAECGVEKLVHH